MKVLGLDLSLSATGYCDEQGKSGVIKTTSNQRVEDRLEAICTYICDLLVPYADVLVIEDLPRGVKHGAVELGMVHGVVRLMMLENWPAKPIVWVPPATLKKYATGKGNASKSDIRVHVYIDYKEDIADDNAADAFVLRQIGLALYGEHVPKLPKVQTEALDKLRGERCPV